MIVGAMVMVVRMVVRVVVGMVVVMAVMMVMTMRYYGVRSRSSHFLGPAVFAGSCLFAIEDPVAATESSLGGT